MKAPVGLLSDRTVLRQQDGGASPRQVRVCRALRSAPNAIFTEGVVKGNGRCSAAFCESAALRASACSPLGELSSVARLRGYKWRSEKSVKAIAPTGAALAFLCFDFFFRIVKGEQPLTTGCGTQHPLRALGGTRVLLAAAPTTPPCFRRRGFYCCANADFPDSLFHRGEPSQSSRFARCQLPRRGSFCRAKRF